MRRWLCLMASILMASILALSATGAAAQHDGHAPRESRAGEPVLFNAEDLQFLRHMSMHHQQALDMSALVPGRSDRPEFLRFARYVARAQAAEIRTMQSLLQMAAARGGTGHMSDSSGSHASHGMHGAEHDPPMAGMLSRAEMAALEGARGDEFERLWLEGMIYHHEGGLGMARAQQLQQLENGRQPYGLQVLIEDILVEQRAEISKMRQWLDAWELTTDGESADTRAPASEVVSPTPGAVLPADAAATFFGLAVDDRGIADVRIAIRDLATDQWWRRDGSWGDRQLQPVEITPSGPGSIAWSFPWTPPAAGRYAITVQAADNAGNSAAGHGTRTFSAE